MPIRDQINRVVARFSGKAQTPEEASRKVPDVPCCDDDGAPQGIRVGHSTDIGYFRDNNEDRFFIDEQRSLYIVADGMGGQAAGDQASQLAVDMIPQQLADLTAEITDHEQIIKAVNQAVVAANNAIIARGDADPAVQNMGTTLVMAVLRDSNMYVAHVGDSRAYLLRDGKLTSLTRDHNLAMALYEANTISKEELQTHRFRHVLWKYLGSKEVGDGPEMAEVKVCSGDRFLLATDGLTGVVTDETLQDRIASYDDPQQCAQDLVKLALDDGSKDNVTCVALFVD